MKFFASTKALKFTKPMKEYFMDKVSSLSHYFNELDGQVTLKKEGYQKKLEVMLSSKIRASVINKDYYSAVDEIVDQLQRQLERYKGLKHKNKTHFSAVNLLPIEEDYSSEEEVGYIVREKVVPTETITREEAIEEMELLGHSFFIFKDRENDLMSVVYKRHDGNYGLLKTIETEQG